MRSGVAAGAPSTPPSESLGATAVTERRGKTLGRFRTSAFSRPLLFELFPVVLGTSSGRMGTSSAQAGTLHSFCPDASDPTRACLCHLHGP